ncbi:MAG: hypothetical protein FWH05_04340 [Oscillospiraceae bacterium]|nr:hypothetical protein [Oscillospiraceae bacterium]
MAANENHLSIIMKDKIKLARAYTVFSQISFVVITPLLVFVVGGVWVVRRFELPDVLAAISIVLGIVIMLASLISYLYKLILIYGKDEKDPYRKYKTDRKDYD